MSEIISVAERVGVSFALLFALGLMFWRLAIWLAPRADRVIDTHCNFIHGLAQQVERQTDLLACQTACLHQLAEGQRELGQLLRTVQATLKPHDGE